ncbi:hemolysin XhlA family protein [Sporosarcina sp. FSL K6-2383]|uniref:hemolysin XhlA family protein n=1 Tax=Sporosarcina sp. FSL K6-2383 TaxID=2921556 RepID=UPI003159E5CA
MAEDDMKMIIEMKEDIASIKTLLSTMNKTNDTAMEASQSAKSAHHRIDKLDRIVFWAGTTIVGTVIIALIALLWKGSN